MHRYLVEDVDNFIVNLGLIEDLQRAVHNPSVKHDSWDPENAFAQKRWIFKILFTWSILNENPQAGCILVPLMKATTLTDLTT